MPLSRNTQMCMAIFKTNLNSIKTSCGRKSIFLKENKTASISVNKNVTSHCLAQFVSGCALQNKKVSYRKQYCQTKKVCSFVITVYQNKREICPGTDPCDTPTTIDFKQEIYGPRREKTCLRGFRQSEFQTGLISYRD